MRARKLDLAAILHDVLQRFEPLAAEGGVRLTEQFPTEPVLAWVERDRIDKVVSNLVSNALRFSPPGGRIHTTLRPTEDTVEISVEDEGPGVPEAHKQTVFDRFFQVEGSRSGGAGLGLALARELVELHGGRIGVADGQQGARFWFTLPLGAAHLAPEEVDMAAHNTPPTMPQDAHLEGDFTVLLVEDHPDLLAFLHELLSERFTVRCARDGAEALEQLSAHPDIQLVVSDIMMPRVDGIELGRQIRASPVHRDLPLLFVSARQEIADRIEGLELADDYLPKPFSAPELMARAAALLRRSQRAAPTPDAPVLDAPVLDAPATPRERFEDRLKTAALPRLHQSGFTAGPLAKAMAMSPRSLQAKMLEVELPTPSEWLRAVRIERAQALLAEGNLTTVGELADAVGMSRSYFGRIYRAVTGRMPKDDLA